MPKAKAKATPKTTRKTVTFQIVKSGRKVEFKSKTSTYVPDGDGWAQTSTEILTHDDAQDAIEHLQSHLEK